MATDRLGLEKSIITTNLFTRNANESDNMDQLEELCVIFSAGALASRPDVGLGGQIYRSTDETPNVFYWDNGESWVVLGYAGVRQKSYQATITHDGAATQEVCTTPEQALVLYADVRCSEDWASGTVKLGDSGNNESLMADSECPKLTTDVPHYGVALLRVTSATTINAYISGAGETGELVVTLDIIDLT